MPECPKRVLEKGKEKETGSPADTSDCRKTEPQGRAVSTQLPEGFLLKGVIFRVCKGLCGVREEMEGGPLRSQGFL